MNDKKLTTQEAVIFLRDELGVPFTQKTLETWRSLGKGPKYLRISSRIFYTKKSLIEFTTGQPVKTSNPAGYNQIIED